MIGKTLLVSSLVLAAPAAAEAALVLAENGASRYQVVIPDEYPAPEIERLLRQGADLVRAAFAAQGADLPVATESTRDPGRPAIYLGATGFAARHGLDPAGFKGWSYALRALGPDLVIIGRDAVNPPAVIRGRSETGAHAGTLKGVTDFLRRFAGARFLYPEGETGVEFLPVGTVAVPADLDERVEPRLHFNCSSTFGGRAGITSIAGAGRGLYLVANNFFPFGEMEYTAHSYPRAIPLEPYAKSNPEYFALIGGKRTVEVESTARKEHYCISNPRVRELIYQDMLRSLDRGYEVTFLGQQDGFRACECADCRALYGTGDDWGEKLWLFHRELAERLLADRPGRRVNIIAYGETLEPPESFNAFPDNVSITLTFYRPLEEVFEPWRRVRVPGGFTGYLYAWGTYNTLGYTPQSTPRHAAELARTFHEFNLRAFVLDGFGHAFGLEGPVYYTFGRMFDDPVNNSAAALFDEFCTAAFREAAAPMRRFYDALYHAVELYLHASGHQHLGGRYQDLSGQVRGHFVRNNPMQALRRLYPAALLEELETLLAEAERAAASDKVVSRLALVRLEFDYLKFSARAAHLEETFRVAPSGQTQELLLGALDERNRFLDRIYEPGEMRYLKRAPIPAWPEFRPFHGHEGVFIIAPRQWRNTPFTWDTAAVRAAPLPAARPGTRETADPLLPANQ